MLLSYKQLQSPLASIRDKDIQHQVSLFAQRYNHSRKKDNLHPVKLAKDVSAHRTFAKAFGRGWIL